MDLFLCSKTDRVVKYDINTYQEIGEISITLFKTESREPNQIIALQKCQNEEWLAIISGKNLIRGEQKPNQLFIYKRVRRAGHRDDWDFHTNVILKDIPEFV
jgi:hypothetical protein